MLRAGTGCAAGQNLAALRSEALELCDVLVVNAGGLVYTELANLPALATFVSIVSQGCILLN
jgi:hypothetical protein